MSETNEDVGECYYQHSVDIISLYGKARKAGDRHAQSHCLELLGLIKIWETDMLIKKKLAEMVRKMDKI